MNAWENKELSLRWPSIILAALTIPCCLCTCFVVMPFGPSEFLARRLAPPLYPGSTTVNGYRSGGPDSMWQVFDSRTPDGIDTVLAFYERRMPGFQKVADSDGTSSYTNGREDNGLLGFLASLTGDGIYPSVGVSIRPDKQDASTTDIAMRIEWPAP